MQKDSLPNRIIVTLYDPSDNIVEGLDGICMEISKFVGLDNIISVYRPENGKYWGFDFKDTEMVKLLKEKFTKVKNTYVVLVSWASECQVASMKLHWVPPEVDLKPIKKKLQMYMAIKKFERGKELLPLGFQSNSNIVIIEGILKNGVKIEDFPHIVELKNRRALLIIQGRQPLCLKCNKLGHKSFQCPYAYCKVCKSFQIREHNCDYIATKITYAGVISAKEFRNDYMLSESDVSDNEELDDNQVKIIKLQDNTAITQNILSKCVNINSKEKSVKLKDDQLATPVALAGKTSLSTEKIGREQNNGESQESRISSWYLAHPPGGRRDFDENELMEAESSNKRYRENADLEDKKERRKEAKVENDTEKNENLLHNRSICDNNMYDVLHDKNEFDQGSYQNG